MLCSKSNSTSTRSLKRRNVCWVDASGSETHLEEVSYDTIVCNLEYGRFRVFVDGNDGLRENEMGLFRGT